MFLVEANLLCSLGFWHKGGKLGHFGEFNGGVRGRLSGLKRELLEWKHPRAQSVGEGRLDEEGDEGGEDGAFTWICLFSFSFFNFLSINGCIFPLHELIPYFRVLDVV